MEGYQSVFPEVYPAGAQVSSLAETEAQMDRDILVCKEYLKNVHEA